MKSQMEIDVDINRPDLAAQYSIDVRTQPVSFTLSMTLVKRLEKFFTNAEMQGVFLFPAISQLAFLTFRALGRGCRPKSGCY